MKRFITGFGLLAFCLALVSLSSEPGWAGKSSDLKNVKQDSGSSDVLKRDPDFGNIPLYFIPNRGQADREALFYVKTSGYALWLTKKGLVFDSSRKAGIQESGSRRQEKFEGGSSPEIEKRPTFEEQGKFEFERDVSRLAFKNTDKNVEVVPCGPTDHRVNYFIGNDLSQWQTDVPTSKAVLYRNIYKNIDLKVYGVERQIEYDWVVRAGGNPEDIRFEYRDVQYTRIDGEGNLIIEGAIGELKHRKPISYQIIEGRRVEVEAAFKRMGHGEYGLSIKDYDPAADLIIDPLILVYSSYLGGIGSESGRSIAVDGTGAIYVCGDTESTDFPTKNAYQKTNRGEHDVFVTKLSPSGKTLEYSTYLGGSGNDNGCYGKGIAIDNNGAAYITGWTYSSNFPLKNAYQKTLRGKNDLFVAKISSGGNSLVYSTYLGGSGIESGWGGIATDLSGAAYVTGYTESTNFPIKTAYQKTNRGKSDVFVTKLSPGGNTLEYSTYLGGSGSDYGYGIAVESGGAAYITGSTDSTNFPAKDAYQKTNRGKSDVFVTKLSPSGKTLEYSTYLGGSDYESGMSIAVGASGAAYITGDSSSLDFPTMNAYQKTARGWDDAFVIKLAPGGKALEYSTYLGGSDGDGGEGIAVDSSGAAYITGSTWSPNFPTMNAYQKAMRGDSDAFITKLSPAGKSLVYSTYLGGTVKETGWDIAVDQSGAVYVTGVTTSTNFPLKNAYQIVNRGESDGFITKLSFPSKNAASKDER